MEESSSIDHISLFDQNHANCRFLELPEPPQAVLEGRILAEHYEIASELGRGGMSVVYKARHILIDDVRAIKFLSSNFTSNANASMRFNREARASTMLNHPGIVRTFEFGLERHLKQPYLVMEYVEGRTLAQLIEQHGRLSLAEFYRIFPRICAALQHAHQLGIVHRDIKPSNIIVGDAGDHAQTVKLLDFGIAKFCAEEEMNSGQNLTRTGELIGSPIYMSPEQISGLSVDARSDLYSLGCTMYEALVGVPPFVGISTIDTLMKHLHENPVPLMDCMVDDFPPILQSIMAKLLEKKKEERFQTVAELMDVLTSGELLQPSIAIHSTSGSLSKKSAGTSFFTLGCLFFVVSLVALVFFTSFKPATHLQETTKKETTISEAQLAKEQNQYKRTLQDRADIAIFKWMRANPEATTITVQPTPGQELEQVSGAALVALSACPDLVSITLKACPNLTNTDLAALATLKKLSGLYIPQSQRLNAQGLAPLVNLPLRRISLADTQLTNAGIDTLIKFPKLEWLDLSQTTVNADNLRKIRTSLNLGDLILQHTHLGETEFKELAKMKMLRSLTLSRNENICAHLHLLHSLEHLSYIDLMATDVRDADLKVLLAMKELTGINLEDTKITDAGLKILARLHSLRTVVLSDCPNLSAKGIKDLRLALGPSASINIAPTATFMMREKPEWLRDLNVSDPKVWGLNETSISP